MALDVIGPHAVRHLILHHVEEVLKVCTVPAFRLVAGFGRKPGLSLARRWETTGSEETSNPDGGFGFLTGCRETTEPLN